TVTGHPYVMQGWRGIPKIFQVGLSQFDNVNLGYHRPLSLVTFAIENQFFPKNAYVGHLDNVLLYGLTGFCLYLLLTRIFRGMYALFSLSVTLLFLAPPIHTEVVANIKSRDEILAFLSLILSLLFFSGIMLFKAAIADRLGAGGMACSFRELFFIWRCFRRRRQ
ncbi:MAG: hypothetical protein DMG19_16815, partial [Acidobacteria bacterium]